MTLRKGSDGKGVERLQKALAALGYDVGPIDGEFGPGTEAAVESLQAYSGLLDDGVVGPATNEAINTYLGFIGRPDLGQEVAPPPPRNHALAESFRWVSTDADKWIDERGKAQGLTRCSLREDIAIPYRLLGEDMADHGCLLTTAGGKRPLKMRTGDPKKDKIGSAQSRTSNHYIGRAFDLALPTGGSRASQPFILQRDPNHSRRWIVFAQGDPDRCPPLEIEATFIQGWRKTSLRTERIRFHGINFTELARQHGFTPIGGRRSFFRGGGFTSSEWWHFQYTGDLTPGTSTFGGELRKLYSLSKCERFLFWDEAKDARWQKEWF